MKEKEKEIIKILIDNKFGTKNLPDAMEWHCSYFWNHALSKDQVEKSKETFKLLNKTVAIPIWLKRSVNEYSELANLINNVTY